MIRNNKTNKQTFDTVIKIKYIYQRSVNVTCAHTQSVPLFVIHSNRFNGWILCTLVLSFDWFSCHWSELRYETLWPKIVYPMCLFTFITYFISLIVEWMDIRYSAVSIISPRLYIEMPWCFSFSILLSVWCWCFVKVKLNM